MATDPILTPARIATLKRLWKDLHPWAIQVQTMADWPNAYGDAGQWSHLLYVMTGDPVRAREAIDRAFKGFAAEPTWGRNETRETTFHMALIYSWLKSEMTADERAEWLKRLYRRADLILNLDPAKSWGTGVSDSDETVGHYFGLVLIAKATAGDHPRAATLLSETPGGTSATVPQMRAAVASYCGKARGGEWIESAEYNLGTLQLLALGAYAAEIEDYPEVAALALECVEQMRWQMTPDFKDSAEWGDDQGPRDPSISKRIPLVAILCGLTGDPTGGGRELLSLLTRGKTPLDYWGDLYRALWVFDPATIPADAKDTAFGIRHAEGVGLVIYRQPSEMIVVHHPRLLSVDHDVPYMADYRWWRNGEWLIDHPIGYSPVATNVNGPLFSNIWSGSSLSPRDRTPVVVETLPGGGFRIASGGSGTFVPPEYSDPPTPFLKSWTRAVEYDGKGSLAITDEFDGSDPSAPAMRPDRYRSWWAGMAEQMQARAGLWESLLHFSPAMPVPVDGAFTKTTAGGQVVTVSVTGADKVIVVKDKDIVTGGDFYEGQRDGYAIRFAADAPQSKIALAVRVGGTVPDPPPVDPPGPPAKTWKEIGREVLPDKIEPVVSGIRTRTASIKYVEQEQ